MRIARVLTRKETSRASAKEDTKVRYVGEMAVQLQTWIGL